MKVRPKYLTSKIILLLCNLIPLIGWIITLGLSSTYNLNFDINKLLSKIPSNINNDALEIIKQHASDMQSYLNAHDNIVSIKMWDPFELYIWIIAIAIAFSFFNFAIIIRSMFKTNDTSLMNFACLSTTMISGIGVVGSIWYYISLDKTITNRTESKQLVNARWLILSGAMITLILSTVLPLAAITSESSSSSIEAHDFPIAFSQNEFKLSFDLFIKHHWLLSTAESSAQIDFDFKFHEGTGTWSVISSYTNSNSLLPGNEISVTPQTTVLVITDLMAIGGSLHVLSISSIAIKSRSSEIDSAIKIPGLIVNALFGTIGTLLMANENKKLDEQKELL